MVMSDRQVNRQKAGVTGDEEACLLLLPGSGEGMSESFQSPITALISSDDRMSMDLSVAGGCQLS